MILILILISIPILILILVLNPRRPHSVRRFPGPFIAGEGIDIDRRDCYFHDDNPGLVDNDNAGLVDNDIAGLVDNEDENEFAVKGKGAR